MSKKLSKNIYLSLDINNIINNKYFKTVLLSYYMITRNIDLFPAVEKFKDPNLIKNLFEEYKKYCAGYDVSVEMNDFNTEDQFKVPEFATIKQISLLHILKKGIN